MSKYINADELKLILNREHLNYSQMIEKKFVLNAIDEMPAADVVEVETLKKYIEANIDEVRELCDEYSSDSEVIRAFQRGRMFGHKCDLEMIKRKETEHKKANWQVGGKFFKYYCPFCRAEYMTNKLSFCVVCEAKLEKEVKQNDKL